MLVYEDSDNIWVDRDYDAKVTGGLCFNRAVDSQLLDVKNVREATNFIYGNFLSTGFVIVSNETNSQVLYAEGVAAYGGHLYVTENIVMMIYVKGMDSVRVHLQAPMKASFRDVSPCRVVMTGYSKITGALPRSYAFVNDCIVASYVKETCPLDASYLRYRGSNLMEAYGIQGGSGGFDFLPNTITGALASVLSQYRHSKSVRTLDGGEGITASSDLGDDVEKMREGLEVSFDRCFKAIRPGSDAEEKHMVPFYLRQASKGDILEQTIMIVSYEYDEFSEIDALLHYMYEASNGVEITAPESLLSEAYLMVNTDTFEQLKARLKVVKSEAVASEVVRISDAIKSLSTTLSKAKFSSLHRFEYAGESIEVEIPVLLAPMNLTRAESLGDAYELVRSAVRRYGVFMNNDLTVNQDLDVHALHEMIEAPINSMMTALASPYRYASLGGLPSDLQFTKEFGCGEEHTYHLFKIGVDEDSYATDVYGALLQSSHARAGGYDNHAPNIPLLVNHSFVSTGKNVECRLTVGVHPCDLVYYEARKEMRGLWSQMLRTVITQSLADLDLPEGSISVEFVGSKTPTNNGEVTYALEGNKVDFGNNVWAIHDPRDGGVRETMQKIGRFFESFTISNKTVDVAGLVSLPIYYYEVRVLLPLGVNYAYGGDRADAVISYLSSNLNASLALAWLNCIDEFIPDEKLVEVAMDEDGFIPIRTAKVAARVTTVDESIGTLSEECSSALDSIDPEIAASRLELLNKITRLNTLVKKVDGYAAKPMWFSRRAPQLLTDKSILSLYPEVL